VWRCCQPLAVIDGAGRRNGMLHGSPSCSGGQDVGDARGIAAFDGARVSPFWRMDSLGCRVGAPRTEFDHDRTRHALGVANTSVRAGRSCACDHPSMVGDGSAGARTLA
jgi:hypothetical protein